MDLGSEDYYYLGDAAAYVPSVPAERRAGVAREAMRQLLREGLVQLYFGNLATNKVVPLPLDEALRAVDDPRAWDGTLHPNGYCFANTAAGDAVYRGEARPGSARHQPNER